MKKQVGEKIKYVNPDVNSIHTGPADNRNTV